MAWQQCHEDYGTPILESTMKKCHQIFELKSIGMDDAIYPIYYDFKSEMEYNKARFVLTSNNTTTLRELEEEFPMTSLSSVE